MIEMVTTISLWELGKHAISWVNNLRRAKLARRQQSLNALRQVVVAAQKTQIYLQHLDQHGDDLMEQQLALAEQWTALSFELDDLGLGKLASRCRMRGSEWASFADAPAEQTEKLTMGLARLRRDALEILDQLNDE
ncbi:hypothetical protein [Aliagarivorans marinus]|uniref:hypothetical protein n=1 Tax=Aliagarivorans marinus TaxID=561965 RepID=UPI0004058392|nr:hypothetical protein [Aliagarivorans marinus]